MRISAIANSYSNYNTVSNYKSRYVSKPDNNITQTFKGCLDSEEEINRVLEMLKNNVTQIKRCSNEEEMTKSLVESIKNLCDTWGSMGCTEDSAGVMLIPPKNLAEFLGEDILDYPDYNELIGICVGVGDAYGPVELWTKAYEAHLVLVPGHILKK